MQGPGSGRDERPPYRQSQERRVEARRAAGGDRLGVVLWHEPGYHAGGDRAAARVLADHLSPAAQQAIQHCRSHRPSTRPIEPSNLFRDGRKRGLLAGHGRPAPRLLPFVEAVSQTNGIGAKQQRLGEPLETDASGELLRASVGSARLICLDADTCSWRSITNNFRSVTFVKRPPSISIVTPPRAWMPPPLGERRSVPC